MTLVNDNVIKSAFTEDPKMRFHRLKRGEQHLDVPLLVITVVITESSAPREHHSESLFRLLQNVVLVTDVENPGLRMFSKEPFNIKRGGESFSEATGHD